MPHVSASSDTLMRQAPPTVGEIYLRKAIEYINSEFNDEDYARNHPELVAAFITACATDFNTALMKHGLQEIASALNDIANR